MAGRQDVFQQAMNQGHSAAWDQMWDRAASFYRQALEEFPDHPQALTNLGLALIELQEFEEALQCYFKAAKAAPEDPVPAEKIAQLYERMGNLDQASLASLRAAELYLKNRDANKAIESWERVTRLNPENLQAHSRLAMIYERMGEPEKAVHEFLASASLLQEAGQPDKAVQTVTQAMKIIPNHPQVIQALSLLKDFKPLPKPSRPRGGTAPLRMAQVRQLQTPKEPSQSEAGLDPVAACVQKALTVMAGMLFEGSDDDRDTNRRGLQAIVVGTGMLRKPVDRTKMILHLSQVVDLQATNDYNQAAEELQRAIDAGLEHPGANFDLGYLYYQSGRYESAMRQIQHAIKHNDYALGSHLLMGSLLHKKNQIKDAALEYLEALRLADAQIVPANQAEDLKQLYEPLIESYRLQTEEQIPASLLDNIRDLLMRPDWHEQMQRARQQMPSRGAGGPPQPLAEMLTEARSSQLIESIAVIYEMTRIGSLRTAIEEAFFAMEQAPTYLPLHTLIADILSKQGDQAAAVAKYTMIAKAYGMRGEAQQAVNIYRKIIDMAPTDLGIRARLVEQLISSGETQAAVNEYIQLAEVYYNLADLDMARKTYTEALRTAQQPNVDRSLRVDILHRMADIDMQSLDWRQAMRIFEQIRTMQPDDEKARVGLIDLNFRLGQEQQALAELDNYLAYLSSSNQEKEAVAFLEKLVEEYPKRVPIRRRLADLLRHMGRVPDAISQLDAIGEILLEAGDRVSAMQTVEMILALNPTNRSDYQQLLEQIRSGSI